MASTTENKSAGSPAEKGPLTKTPSPDESLDNYADVEDSDSENQETAAENTNMMQESEDTSSDKKPLSFQRRLCLLASLMLCIFTVFAFAFLLPCHKDSCKETKCIPKSFWAVNFTNASPVMLKRIDGNNNAIDVVVGLHIESRNSNNSATFPKTCASSECESGLISLSSCNGHNIWKSGFDGSLALLVCQNQEKHKKSLPGCLVLQNQSKLFLLNSLNGKRKWAADEIGTVHAYRTIRDVDGDGIRDIVIIRDSPITDLAKGSSKRYIIKMRGTVGILSGKTGRQIGMSVTIPGHQNGTVVLLVHEVFSYKQFILIGAKLPTQGTGTLLAIAIKDLATKARNWKRKSGIPWGPNKPDTHTGFITLFKDMLVLTEPMIADLNNDGVYDIVLLTKDQEEFTVQALNGKNVKLLWKRTLPTDTIDRALSASITLSKKLSHIGIMLKFPNHTSAILVLNGHTGAIMWSFHMRHLLAVPPVGIPQMKGVPGGLLLWLPKIEILDFVNTTIVKLLEDEDEGPVETSFDNRHSREELSQFNERVKRSSESKNNLRKRIVQNLANNILIGKLGDGILQNTELPANLKRELLRDAMLDILRARNRGTDNSDSDDNNNNDESDYDSRAYGERKLDLEKKIMLIERLKKRLQESSAEKFDSLQGSEVLDDFRGHTVRRSTRKNMSPLEKFLSEWRSHIKRRNIDRDKLPGSDMPTGTVQYNITTTPNTPEAITNISMSTETDKPTDASHVSESDVIPLHPDTPGPYYDKGNNSSLCGACGKHHPDAADILSAVLLYKDGSKLRVKEIIEERPKFLEPDQYKKMFGEDLPSPVCVKLLPHVTSTPVITSLDKLSGKLEMVYIVDQMAVACQGNLLDATPKHIMIIKKIDVPLALERTEKLRREGRDGISYPGGDLEGSGKRNEVFESPFSHWGFS